MTSYAIEAHSLSKTFRVRTQRRTSLKERVVRGGAPEPEVFWALRDATFSVSKGSSLGLIGHNGSGKSTALKVLAGIYRPSSGSVTVQGSVSALLEVGAGFHPELTGRENIRLNATILGFTGREIDRLMGKIIEFADIDAHIDAPIKHYSSGMYVRLGFAVAVMVRPDILLVDEVIAVGDEEFQRKCYEYLYELRRAGTSLVIVSHGLSQITDLCDQALWLEHGEVRKIGTSRKVVRGYLDAVNEREIARNKGAAVPGAMVDEESSSNVPAIQSVTGLPVRSDRGRRGTGEIRITKLVILEETGTAAQVLISGRDASFVIHYESTEGVDDPVFGLGFDNASDFTVGGVNTAHLGQWRVAPGNGSVVFRATPLLLTGGTYRVRVQVHVASHVIDSVDDGYSLVVRSPDVEVDGAYLQPGIWQVADNA